MSSEPTNDAVDAVPPTAAADEVIATTDPTTAAVNADDAAAAADPSQLKEMSEQLDEVESKQSIDGAADAAAPTVSKDPTPLPPAAHAPVGSRIDDLMAMSSPPITPTVSLSAVKGFSAEAAAFAAKHSPQEPPRFDSLDAPYSVYHDDEAEEEAAGASTSSPSDFPPLPPGHERRVNEGDSDLPSPPMPSSLLQACGGSSSGQKKANKSSIYNQKKANMRSPGAVVMGQDGALKLGREIEDDTEEEGDESSSPFSASPDGQEEAEAAEEVVAGIAAKPGSGRKHRLHAHGSPKYIDHGDDCGDDEDEDEEEDDDEDEDDEDGGSGEYDPNADDEDDDDDDDDDDDEEGSVEEGECEWENDDDAGYRYVMISAADFAMLEEESSQQLMSLQRLEAELRRVEESDFGTGAGAGCEGEEEEEEEEEYHDACEYQGYYTQDDAAAQEQYEAEQQGQRSMIRLDDGAEEEEVGGGGGGGGGEREASSQADTVTIEVPNTAAGESTAGSAVYMDAEEHRPHPVDDLSKLDVSSSASGVAALAAEAAAGIVAIDHMMHPANGADGTAAVGATEGVASSTAIGSRLAAEAATGFAKLEQAVGSWLGAGSGATVTNNSVSATAPPVPVAPAAAAPVTVSSTVNSRRREELMGKNNTFQGADGEIHSFFNLKVIFKPFKTGFEEHKDFTPTAGTIVAGRYEVQDLLGEAAFSSAIRCYDLAAEGDEDEFVCLKVIKNNKDFFDQSLDEIKLLQYINSQGDPDNKSVLRLIDYFYCQEHLFIVSELLKENLYEVGKAMRESGQPNYFTLPRLKKITYECLTALDFIHSLNLIHCDVKPENIVIKSYSRCEIKVIDFGSSCFTSDHLTTYIQSRSYRAPEVILGCKYDDRIDVWSIGAVIAELFTGYVLFQNDSLATMLARITGILGPFPESVLQAGTDTNKYFTLSNIAYEPVTVTNQAHGTSSSSSRHRVDETGFNLIYPKKTTLEKRLHIDVENEPDHVLFLDFVQQLLELDHTKRVTAKQALQHPWLKDATNVEVNDYTYTHVEDDEDGEEYEDDDEEEDEDEEEDDDDDDDDDDEDED